jgi:hypothetical protein
MAYTGCPLTAHRSGAHWQILIKFYKLKFAIGYISMYTARMVIDRMLNR